MQTRSAVVLLLLLGAAVSLSLAQETPAISPLSGKSASDITARFGPRTHPVLGITKAHDGVDFEVPEGTPVRATAGGMVAFAGANGDYGLQVRIRHAGGYRTSYAHLSRLVTRKGARVRQGEVIGYSGRTGLGSSPHLHYEVVRNGIPVDPSRFMGQPGSN